MPSGISQFPLNLTPDRLQFDEQAFRLISETPYSDERSERVMLSPEVMARLDKSRAAVMRIDKAERPYYGINTGFGPLCRTRILPENMGQLQVNLLLSHAVGVGPAVPDPVVRLMLLSKIAALSQGHSGVQPTIVERLCDFLNEDLLPVVPAQGSVGASGDLAPLAHMGLPLIGLGRVRLRGTEMDAAEALEACNLEPIALGPKDGLAILNGTQYISAYSAYTLTRAKNLLRSADIVLAISLEALRGSNRPFDQRLFELRSSGRGADCAANIRTLMEGSEILESHKDCSKVQDPYSLRCAPQVHGSARYTIENAWTILEEEFSAVTDNPIVMDDGDVISAGNFHGEPLGMQMDFAAIAIAEIANISERRTYLLLGGEDELPRLLMKDTGLNSGFMIPQYTSAALVSENKVHCHPATVDSIPTSLGQEDHVSMGSISARKALQVLENAEVVLGIELMCAAQGMDFRRPLHANKALEAGHAAVRMAIPHAEQDRLFTPDINAATNLIRSGQLVAAVEGELGEGLR